MGVAAIAAMTLAPMSASATNTVVYDNIPSPQPGNVASVGYEATSASEFGGQIQLAGTARNDLSVTVLMSSWGCESGSWNGGDCETTEGASFTEPITLNVYSVDENNAVGDPITSESQTFTIPYRPSASEQCTGEQAGEWYDSTDGTCNHGLAYPITFNALDVALPNEVIVSLAYNTTHYGASPYGEDATCYTTDGGCGYDSLNVGLFSPPSTGTDPVPADTYANYESGGSYCDKGVGGTGSFRLDAGCWTGYQPAIRVAALNTSLSSADQCKKGGWQQFSDPTFKNQGDCVSFVKHQEHGRS